MEGNKKECSTISLFKMPLIKMSTTYEPALAYIIKSANG